MNSTLNSALLRASRKLSIDVNTVEEVYMSYWNFIRSKVAEVPLKPVSVEEFILKSSNFNIPYIGKLYADIDRFNRYKRQQKYYQNVKIKKN